MFQLVLLLILLLILELSLNLQNILGFAVLVELDFYQDELWHSFLEV